MPRDRGRDGGISATPPSEPYGRISRIRLSGQWDLGETDCKHASRVPDSTGPAPQTSVVGPPWASRVSIRSVHTERSIHHPPGARTFPACLAWVAPDPIPGRSSRSSFLMVVPSPLPCAPSLPGRYPASSLLWTLSLPPGGSSGLAAMNTVLPRGSPCLLRPCFPLFRPQPPRRASPGICFHPPFGLPGTASQRTRSPGVDRGRSSHLGLGLDFAQPWQARRSAWPNQVHIASLSHFRFVTDRWFTSGSSPPRVATTQ